MKTLEDIHDIVLKLLEKRIYSSFYWNMDTYPFPKFGYCYNKNIDEIHFTKILSPDFPDEFNYQIDITDDEEEYSLICKKENNTELYYCIEKLYNYFFVKNLMYLENFVISNNKIALRKRKKVKEKKKKIQEYDLSIII